MNPFLVDGSGVTQPVSGTFWQTTQPVSGTFWQTTQPVSLASVPSHAVTTELTTDDLDTGAGTDARAVVGIALAADGGAVIAGADNPIPISDNGGSVTVDGTVGISGTVAVDASGTTVSVTGPLTNTELRAAHVDVDASQVGTWNIGNVSGTVSLPTGAATESTLSTLNGKVTACNTGAVVLSAGTAAIGKLSANSGVDIGDVDVASVVPGTGATSLGKAEDAAHTSGDTGVMILGVRKDTAASLAGTDGDYTAPIFDSTGKMHVNVGSSLVAGTNIIGKVGIDQTTPGTTNAVQAVPGTSGGLSMSKVISAASTNATSVKSSAGQVYSVQAFNTNAAARYLKLYNKASAPTVGTDTPVKTLLIPGNTAGTGFVINWPAGIAFSTGIAIALTTGIADSSTGAVAASEIVVNIDYK
jgi:hypothetical protein